MASIMHTILTCARTGTQVEVIDEVGGRGVHQ